LSIILLKNIFPTRCFVEHFSIVQLIFQNASGSEYNSA
jgi:hypothetical protein